MGLHNMIVVDSGLGGISVVRALARLDPTRAITYVADTAGFPYGARSVDDINARAQRLITALLAQHPTPPVVLACNTLSTLCLDSLRSAFAVPFVGTVPAVKTAAQVSTSRRFTLLATPNTASSAYSRDLIAQFASDCVVDNYGAPELAAMAERMMLGQSVADDALRAELAPAFFDDTRGRTDSIVLGCTHYPLITEALSRVAPWPVTWIDSSNAIAKRALSLNESVDTQQASIAYVTRAEDVARYREVFAREGFADVQALTLS